MHSEKLKILGLQEEKLQDLKRFQTVEGSLKESDYKRDQELRDELGDEGAKRYKVIEEIKAGTDDKRDTQASFWIPENTPQSGIGFVGKISNKTMCPCAEPHPIKLKHL